MNIDGIAPLDFDDECWQDVYATLEDKYGELYSDNDKIRRILGSDGSRFVRGFIELALQIYPTERYLNSYLNKLRNSDYLALSIGEKAQFIARFKSAMPMNWPYEFEHAEDMLHAYDYKRLSAKLVVAVDCIYQQLKVIFDVWKRLRDYLEGELNAQSQRAREGIIRDEFEKSLAIDAKHCSVNDGFVYVLQSPALPEIVKIGFTALHPDARAVEISRQLKLEQPFVVVKYFRTKDPFIVEQRVHRVFAASRVDYLTAKKYGIELFGVSVEDASRVIKEEISRLDEQTT